MKICLLLFSIIFVGCTSTNVSNIYYELDNTKNGYRDKFESLEIPFEVYGQSKVSNENAVAVAFLRANELCEGKFSVEEIGSGIVVTVHCSNCGVQYFYKGMVQCQP